MKQETIKWKTKGMISHPNNDWQRTNKHNGLIYIVLKLDNNTPGETIIKGPTDNRTTKDYKIK